MNHLLLTDKHRAIDGMEAYVIRPDMHPLVAAGLGIGDTLTDREMCRLAVGLRADGGRIEGKVYAKVRSDGTQPLGALGITLSADKSVSVAYALAPESERTMIRSAHTEAARETMALIAGEIGQARLGKGGMGGTMFGHVGWIEFPHTTARAVIGADGQPIGPADPDLHSHFMVPASTFWDSGRVGSLHTNALPGFIKKATSFYHARLGTLLRGDGFDVEADRQTGAAKMTAVPNAARSLFSKRSNIGETNARASVATAGLDWDALKPHEQSARIKRATQARSQKERGGLDGVPNPDDWRRQAKEISWEPTTLRTIVAPIERTDAQRHRAAYQIALTVLEAKLEQGGGQMAHHEPGVAALRGLIAAVGIHRWSDVSAVVGIIQTEGVSFRGQRWMLAQPDPAVAMVDQIADARRGAVLDARRMTQTGPRNAISRAWERRQQATAEERVMLKSIREGFEEGLAAAWPPISHAISGSGLRRQHHHRPTGRSTSPACRHRIRRIRQGVARQQLMAPFRATVRNP